MHAICIHAGRQTGESTSELLWKKLILMEIESSPENQILISYFSCQCCA